MGDGQVRPGVAVTRALSGPVAYPGTGSGVAEVEGSRFTLNASYYLKL